LLFLRPVFAPRTHPSCSFRPLQATLFQAQNSPARRSTPGKSLLDVILLLRRQKISFRRTIVVGSPAESDQAKKICHK
jgi:hypothetical protein